MIGQGGQIRQREREVSLSPASHGQIPLPSTFLGMACLRYQSCSSQPLSHSFPLPLSPSSFFFLPVATTFTIFSFSLHGRPTRSEPPGDFRRTRVFGGGPEDAKGVIASSVSRETPPLEGVEAREGSQLDEVQTPVSGHF